MAGKNLLAGLLLSVGLALGGAGPSAQAASGGGRDEVQVCVALDVDDNATPNPHNGGCGNSGCGNSGCRP